MTAQYPRALIMRAEDSNYYIDELNIAAEFIGLSQIQLALEISQDKAFRHVRIILDLLCQEKIDISGIRKQAFKGVGPLSTLRGVGWRLASGQLPQNKNKWYSVLQKRLIEYESHLQNFILKASKPSSHDLLLWGKIERDVVRTRCAEGWFNKPTHNYTFSTKTHASLPLLLKGDRSVSYRYDSLTRILYIFAKCFPEVGYCQGMNQIAAVILFAYSTLPISHSPLKRYSESDSFDLVSRVFMALRQNFDHQADKLEAISLKVDEVCKLLNKLDRKLYKHLISQNIHPTCLLTRWVLIGLTDQFPMTDALRLWDAYVCSPSSYGEFMTAVVAGCLILRREQMLERKQLQTVLLRKQQGCEVQALISKAELVSTISKN